ncbi:MAG TPA: hypothetical protein VLA19_12800 [Herpetosiphonaceae bacterium]|nr:hypothetical protein [Herpetosiphonaceae bacterium]
MAFEILNSADITPHRLHALVRLVPRLREPRRADLLDLLQPSVLPHVKNQTAASNAYAAARTCNLIREEPGGIVQLTVAPRTIENLDDFRRHMQRILLRISDESADNYLLNLFTAWYAVQNERVLRLERKQLETRFNAEVFPHVESRQFNETKLNGWRTWAAFLGSGYPLRLGSGEVIMPDAHERLLPLLDQLLPLGARIAGFDSFAAELAEQCPDLDGGVLFERCWQTSRGAEMRGNSLSLMLSTALRVLHDAGHIELILQPDAELRWQLFPAAGHGVRQVSHIRRRDS